MSNRLGGRLLILGVAGLILTGCTMPAPLRVMSFNIRCADADDGRNGWKYRRQQVISTIRAREPDVLAVQEAVFSQVNELRKALPEYGFVGVGRHDGASEGEFVPIFYRKARFTRTDQGHFWLSETPGRPGSVGWDAALPRVVTWATLRFNDLPWRSVRVVNVHLDHQGERARLESAKLLRRMVESVGGRPLLVVGDFNCTPGSSPYRILTEQRGNLTALRDAHATGPALPSCVSYASVEPGTYHGFSGQAHGGRIDWILLNRQFDALKAEIDRGRVDGRYPSDHFPVIAEVRLRGWAGSP